MSGTETPAARLWPERKISCCARRRTSPTCRRPIRWRGRLDHALANLQLLETARADGVEAILLDPDNRVTCIGPGKYVLPRTEYFYFSLLPIDAVLRGVTIEGAKYPLCDADARRGDSLTISNEWIEPTVRLRIREGLCWLICSGAAAR